VSTAEIKHIFHVKDYNNSSPEKHKTSQSMQEDLAMEERGKKCGRMHKFPSSFQFLQFPSNPQTLQEEERRNS
jgi:hypothetical protein